MDREFAGKALERTAERCVAITAERCVAIPATLFEFSLMGYYAPGGGGFGRSEYIWKYKEVRAQFNEAARIRAEAFSIGGDVNEAVHFLGAIEFEWIPSSAEVGSVRSRRSPTRTLA